MTPVIEAPSPDEIEAFNRRFVEEYVTANRSVMITDAYDVAHGGCGPFAEELVEAIRERFPGVEAHDRDTSDMLRDDADLPQPDDFEYAFHVYVEVRTSRGALFYDALTPQGMPLPSMLSFNREQIRHASAYRNGQNED
jgi:hypothetical protein